MNKKEPARFNFLGLNFHIVTFDQTIEQMEYFIQTKKPHMIFAPTVELAVRSKEDYYLKCIYNRSDLLMLDSYVIYYGAKLFRKPAIEPVNAARLMLAFLEVAYKKDYRLYLLGAKNDIVNKAVENIRLKYPGINIVGWHHGYFDFENYTEVTQDIKDKNPDVLFVAMSSPLKENFISINLEKMKVPVCLGVGGTFDIIAGKCRMAPTWVSRAGLEWFYRLIQEPKRLWKRYTITNAKFLWHLFKECFNKASHKN